MSSSRRVSQLVLSYFVNNRVKHEIVESSSDKKGRKNISFQDVAGVIQDMVNNNPNCVHAVVASHEGSQGCRRGSDEQALGSQSEVCGGGHGHQGCRRGSDEQALGGQTEVCEGQGHQECQRGSDEQIPEGQPSTSSSGKSASSPATDKEVKDAARASKKSAKKTAKEDVKKAKLAAANNVQKDKIEVNRGRPPNRNPQCYVCHQLCDNSKKLSDHLNYHRVKKCQNCGLFVSARDFGTHSKGCSNAPKLHNCDQCDYKTHKKSHLLAHAKVHQEKLPCSTCNKEFATKERLAAHMACHERGIRCSQCPEVFRTVGAKYWHIRKKHMNKTIKSSAGFFSLDSSFLKETEGTKKSPKVHRCDQCPYKSFKQSNFSRHKLSHSKPKKEKKIGVYRCVKGCHYYTKNTYNFGRHIETCRHFKATRPKTRPLITKTHVCNIANTVAISNKKMKKVLHAIRDVIGEDMFEKGIDTALADNLNRLGDDYETTQLEYKDKDGQTQVTAFVCIKDINDIIAKVIKKRKIKKPLVVIGSDGGQGKVITSLQIHDLSKKGKDRDGLEPGGGGVSSYWRLLME